MRLLLLPVVVAFAAGAPSALAEDFGCPLELASDQSAGGQPQSFKFRYVSFFDGEPAEDVDLAPEEGPDQTKLEQRWEFTRMKGRPIVMICRYHATKETVRKEVPLGITECRLEGLITAKGEIVGSPALECK